MTRTSAAGLQDEDAYQRLVEPLRGQLYAHCYRMLGSTHDAEDALQDAMLRAWRGLSRFKGESSLRSWLYTITTNACIDAIGRRSRRAMPVDLGPSSEHAQVDDQPNTEIAWLDPLPDGALHGLGDVPAARYETRESVELAFVAALQHLPGNQRAALLLVEVLGFSAREVADTLDTTTASVNSALQRARKVVDERVAGPSQQRTLRAMGDVRLRQVVTRYASALQRGDADTLVELLTDDATWSMPPLPGWYQGSAALRDFLLRMPLTCGWRHLPTSANGQPALGCYRWFPDEGHFRGFAVDVLTFREERIAAVTAFLDHDLFGRLGLPAVLPADHPLL